MPSINVKTSAVLTQEKRDVLKADLGRAIACFPGKSEQWLMVTIEDGLNMWFRGNASADTALIDVDILGDVSAAASEKMTAALCGIMDRELGIPQDRVYVKYAGYRHWGWNGGNF